MVILLTHIDHTDIIIIVPFGTFIPNMTPNIFISIFLYNTCINGILL